jgi:hypothetical protein
MGCKECESIAGAQSHAEDKCPFLALDSFVIPEVV